MMQAVRGIVRRECRLAFLQPGDVLQPIIFLLLVATLFPLALGPNPSMLNAVGAGVIWVSAILAILLSLDGLFKQDQEDGTLEQYMLSPQPLWLLCFTKVVVHWMLTIVPLLIVSPLVAVFFKLSWDMYWALILTLLMGTPILAFIGGIAVSLTIGLNRGGILLGLLVLPLFIPVLIFATSAIDAVVLQLSYNVQLAWIGALLMLTLAFAPQTIAYGLKVSQN